MIDPLPVDTSNLGPEVFRLVNEVIWEYYPPERLADEETSENLRMEGVWLKMGSNGVMMRKTPAFAESFDSQADLGIKGVVGPEWFYPGTEIPEFDLAIDPNQRRTLESTVLAALLNRDELNRARREFDAVERLDENLRGGKAIRDQRSFLQDVLAELHVWYGRNGHPFPSGSAEVERTGLTDAQVHGHELAASHRKVKQLQERNRALQNRTRGSRPSKEDLRDLIDTCRLRNGKANFSAVGRELGVTGDTAKKWIKNELLLPYCNPK